MLIVQHSSFYSQEISVKFSRRVKIILKTEGQRCILGEVESWVGESYDYK